MKSILVEDIVQAAGNTEQVQFQVDGKTVQGWAIAKPLNYSADYLDKSTVQAWVQEIKAGRAIAVHFTQDEIECGETPTLYSRHMKSQEAEEK